MLLVCAALLSELTAHGAPPVQAAGVFAGRSLPRVGASATPQEALLATGSAPVAQLPQGPGTRVGVPAAHAGHTTVLQTVLLALLVPACCQACSTVKPGFQTKPRLTLRKELTVTCLLLLLATPVAGGRRSRAQRRTAALGSSGGTSSVLGSQPAGGPPAASPARDCPQNPLESRRFLLTLKTHRLGLHAGSAEARTGGAAGAGPSWSCPCWHRGHLSTAVGGSLAASPARDCPQNPLESRRFLLTLKTHRLGLHAGSAGPRFRSDWGSRPAAWGSD